MDRSPRSSFNLPRIPKNPVEDHCEDPCESCRLDLTARNRSWLMAMKESLSSGSEVA